MRITPGMTGAVIGALAVAAQWLFDTSNPQAYGVCIACHARDMLGWIFNNLAYLNIAVTSASIFTPLLTVFGILLGAHAAARRHTEFSRQESGGEARMFLLGFLVMLSALLLAACPIRLLLRVAYGEPLGVFAGAWMVIGIISGVEILRRWEL